VQKFDLPSLVGLDGETSDEVGFTVLGCALIPGKLNREDSTQILRSATHNQEHPPISHQEDHPYCWTGDLTIGGAKANKHHHLSCRQRYEHDHLRGNTEMA